MKLTALLPLLLAFAFATPAAAQDKSYADVRHLYEKMLLTIEETDEHAWDAHYAELAWDLMNHGDLELLARIPPKVSNPSLHADVTAALALAHARTGDCPVALEVAERAFGPGLFEGLQRSPPSFAAAVALRSIIRTFARCMALERAEAAVAAYEPQLRPWGYLPDAYSAIAVSLEAVGARAEAQRYLAKARASVSPLPQEHRVEALHRIAANQVAAGRYNEALETIESMDIALDRMFHEPPVLVIADRWKWLKVLGHQMSSQGHWEIDGAIFEGDSEVRHYYSIAPIEFHITEYLEMERQDAIEGLSKVQPVLLRDEQQQGLVMLARAFGKIGEEPRAVAILDALYGEVIAKLLDDDPETRFSGSDLYVLARLIEGYVLVGQPQAALERLTSDQWSGSQHPQLLQAWGMLFGYAELHGDQVLRRQAGAVRSATRSPFPFDYGTFLYYLDQGAFEPAETLIEGMTPRSKLRNYERLARAKMGVPYWHYFINRDRRPL